MAQGRGAVPVELTGGPALGGKTLECWGTAKTILQDTWDEKRREEKRKDNRKLARELEKKCFGLNYTFSLSM